MQSQAHSHRRRFLPISQVSETGHPSTPVNVENGFFERSGQEHASIHFDHKLFVDLDFRTR
jgi:hypothetical protein